MENVIYVMEYYSAMKKKEIFSIVTRWMNLEGIMLNEISQTKINTVCSHLHMESKKSKLIEAENRLVVARGRG